MSDTALTNPPGRLARGLDAAAMVILLACVSGRCFLGETPYRLSASRGISAALHEGRSGPQAGGGAGGIYEREELARVTFAVLILLACLCRLSSAAAAPGRPGAIPKPLWWLAAAFVLWSLLSVAGAGDKRSALDAWLEQATLICAMLLAMDLFSGEAGRRRFGVLVVVMAAVGATLAVKAFWQVLVEIPDTVEFFRRNPKAVLYGAGHRPGSAEARMLRERLMRRTANGFGPLANIFGSLLVILLSATAALAAAKVGAARRHYRAWKQTRKHGEVHAPTLAAVAAVAAAVMAAVAIVLTRSRGAIIAGFLAGVAAVAAAVAGEKLSRHRRKILIVAAVVVVAGAAAVVGYGLRFGRLPTKTMTIRWQYWSASAEIIAERPLLGAGAGNFPSAYLQHRLPAAEEAVKSPHNFVVQPTAEYGLVGGAFFLGLLAWVLVLAWRGAWTGAETNKDFRPLPMILTVGVPAATVIVCRMVFAHAGAAAAVFVLDALLPAVVLAAAAVVLRSGGGAAFDPDSGIVRAGVLCGLGGFLLHNVVTFSLFVPATAMVFWTFAGALAGRGAKIDGRSEPAPRRRWPAAVALAVAIAAVVVLLWRPVYTRTRLRNRAIMHLRQERLTPALAALKGAAESDTLDASAAAQIAHLYNAVAPAEDAAEKQSAVKLLEEAYRWSLEAIRRDKWDSAGHKLAGTIAARMAGVAADEPAWRNRAIEHYAEAVRLDPQNMRLRIEYADVLLEAGRNKKCLRQLNAALRRNSRLPPESLARLSSEEKQKIRRMKSRATAGR